MTVPESCQWCRTIVFIVNFEHVRPFSSVTINDPEHEMFAGLRSLDHRSNTFFACILFSYTWKYILLGFYIKLSKIFSVPVDQCHSFSPE